MVTVKGGVKMMKKCTILVIFLSLLFSGIGLCVPVANERNNPDIVKWRYPSGGPIAVDSGYYGPIGNVQPYPPPPPPPIRRRPISPVQFYRPVPIVEVRTITPYYNTNCFDNWGYYNPMYCNTHYYRETRIMAPHSVIRMGF